jgi:hypothetical protein
LGLRLRPLTSPSPLLLRPIARLGLALRPLILEGLALRPRCCILGTR